MMKMMTSPWKYDTLSLGGCRGQQRPPPTGICLEFLEEGGPGGASMPIRPPVTNPPDKTKLATGQINIVEQRVIKLEQKLRKPNMIQYINKARKMIRRAMKGIYTSYLDTIQTQFMAWNTKIKGNKTKQVPPTKLRE